LLIYARAVWTTQQIEQVTFCHLAFSCVQFEKALVFQKDAFFHRTYFLPGCIQQSSASAVSGVHTFFKILRKTCTNFLPRDLRAMAIEQATFCHLGVFVCCLRQEWSSTKLRHSCRLLPAYLCISKKGKLR